MKSAVYYNCKELIRNNEIGEFTKHVYLKFYNDERYKHIVDEYGKRFNIKRPHLYFHNMSTVELINKLTEFLVYHNNRCFISIDCVIEYTVNLIEKKEVKFSVLDDIIAQQLVMLPSDSEIRDMILARNVIGEDTKKSLDKEIRLEITL